MFEIKKGSCHCKAVEFEVEWHDGPGDLRRCKLCGIYTHHQRRTAPDEFGYNIACLDDQSVFDGIEIELANGASNSLVAESL